MKKCEKQTKKLKAICEICGKPQKPAELWVNGRWHLGCLVEDYLRLQGAITYSRAYEAKSTLRETLPIR